MHVNCEKCGKQVERVVAHADPAKMVTVMKAMCHNVDETVIIPDEVAYSGMEIADKLQGPDFTLQLFRSMEDAALHGTGVLMMDGDLNLTRVPPEEMAAYNTD